MACQAPEQAEIFLTGKTADLVLTRPEAGYSVPVEDTVQPGEQGWLDDQELFHIGVPDITAAD